jgi:uncharacterized protein YggU (UPF0235/DUF167 family)
LAACFRLRTDGLDLFVRLTPKASVDAIDGLKSAADGAVYLAVRVRAVPEKGAANTALERLLAKCLGVPRTSVHVAAGSTSRLKTVRLAGDGAMLAETLEGVIGLGRGAEPD